MSTTTETTNPKIAGTADKVGGLLSNLVLGNMEPMSPTEVGLGSWLKKHSTGSLAITRAERVGRLWKEHWPEKSFNVLEVLGFADRECTQSLLSIEEMLSPEKRAILEHARAIRRKIGPVPWKISDILRQMDEENA